MIARECQESQHHDASCRLASHFEQQQSIDVIKRQTGFYWYNRHMTGSLSRRDFLKLGVLGLGGLAFRPFGDIAISEKDENLARITIESVSVHSQPWDESTIVYQRYRDDLVNVYYKVISPHGPEFNPVWYRVWGGYIHNARLQHVKSKTEPGRLLTA
jgi:hypothetical protein